MKSFLELDFFYFWFQIAKIILKFFQKMEVSAYSALILVQMPNNSFKCWNERNSIVSTTLIPGDSLDFEKILTYGELQFLKN